MKNRRMCAQWMALDKSLTLIVFCWWANMAQFHTPNKSQQHLWFFHSFLYSSPALDALGNLHKSQCIPAVENAGTGWHQAAKKPFSKPFRGCVAEKNRSLCRVMWVQRWYGFRFNFVPSYFAFPTRHVSLIENNAEWIAVNATLFSTILFFDCALIFL